jgi:DNA (cytosine-5)-methyltransferase 1
MASERHSRQVRSPIAVEIFAGIGGLSLGLERAGFDVAAAVEFDSNHSAVHNFNFPKTALIRGDAAKVSLRQVSDAVRRGLNAHGCEERRSGPIDLLAGGPPCQGFSDGGTHDPNDKRNQLIFEFARFVRELKPRFFIMENVPGLLRSRHKTAWDRLINQLTDSGYGVATPAVLSASDFGVPQNRDRLFLLGWRVGEDPLSAPAAGAFPTAKVRDAFRALPNASSFPELYEQDVLAFDRLGKRGRESLADADAAYARRLRDDDPARGFRRPWADKKISGMALTHHSDKVVKRFEKTRAGERDSISRYARLDPSGLCPTLRSGTGPDHGSHTPPRPIHPSGKRVITVREAARLHSFPDWFSFHATKWHAWRGIGNAVPPLLAQAVARQIAERCEATDSLRGTLPWGDTTKLGYEEAW